MQFCERKNLLGRWYTDPDNICRTRRSRASSVSPASSVSSSPKSASPTFDDHLVQYYPARKPYRSESCFIPEWYSQQFPFRMASSFELSSDQPSLYYQRARKLTGDKKDSENPRGSNKLFVIAANSYQNLFGEPTERHRPLSKKVSKLTPPEPRSRKQKPLPG